LGASNVRKRILGPAIENAEELLRRAGDEPLPEGITPHSLRRTFASVLVAIGRDPAYAMAQMGHTTAGFTLSVYARAMQGGEAERERLRVLVGSSDLRRDPIGTGAVGSLPG
jgi:integrase